MNTSYAALAHDKQLRAITVDFDAFSPDHPEFDAIFARYEAQVTAIAESYGITNLDWEQFGTIVAGWFVHGRLQ